MTLDRRAIERIRDSSGNYPERPLADTCLALMGERDDMQRAGERIADKCREEHPSVWHHSDGKWHLVAEIARDAAEARCAALMEHLKVVTGLLGGSQSYIDHKWEGKKMPLGTRYVQGKVREAIKNARALLAPSGGTSDDKVPRDYSFLKEWDDAPSGGEPTP